MTLAEQIVIIVALCTVPFSYGQTSNIFYCTSKAEDLKISGTVALFQGVLVLLGLVLGQWIIGFAGSMGFALGVGTLAIAGIRMIMDARKGDPDDRAFKLNDTVMIMAMALAVSINAFIPAIGLPAFNIHMPLFSGLILVCTFCATFAGIKTGKKYANFKLGKVLRILGGTAILVVSGLRIYFSYFG